MAVATAHVVSPAQIVRTILGAIPEVEQVYIYAETAQRFSILTVINTKSPSAQKRIFQSELEIMEALPGYEFGFDLVILDGRPLQQVVSPRGTLLFARG